MEHLHQIVLEGQDIEPRMRHYPDLDVAQWTKSSKSLLHTAAEAGNLEALDCLLKMVIIKFKFLSGGCALRAALIYGSWSQGDGSGAVNIPIPEILPQIDLNISWIRCSKCHIPEILQKT